LLRCLVRRLSRRFVRGWLRAFGHRWHIGASRRFGRRCSEVVRKRRRHVLRRLRHRRFRQRDCRGWLRLRLSARCSVIERAESRDRTLLPRAWLQHAHR
jgi:hypothetical protein